MARTLVGIFISVALGLAATTLHAGEQKLAKDLDELNLLTGLDPWRGVLKDLVQDKERARKLIDFCLPAAQKGALSYNAALVLGGAAVELKDLKTAEVFLRVCMDQAAKLQSTQKLFQSYGALIESYFSARQYAQAARLAKAILELNTNDEKQREVIGTTVGIFGEVSFLPPQDGFDPAGPLRQDFFESYVKATSRQGKYDQALKLTEGRIKRKDEWGLQRLKGWVLNEAGKLPDAAAAYESALEQVGKDPRLLQAQKDLVGDRIRHDIAWVYADLDKLDRAGEHLEYLIKKHPDSPLYCNDVGYFWAVHGIKLDEAEKLVRKALDLDRELRKKNPAFNPKEDRDSGAYLDSLGWVRFKQKKLAEAKTLLLQALEDKRAQTLEVFDHLGDVHLALSERDLAMKAWQKGLQHVNDDRRDRQRKAAVEKKLEALKSN